MKEYKNVMMYSSFKTGSVHFETNPSILSIAFATPSPASAELFTKTGFDIAISILLYMKVFAGSQ